MLTKFDIIRESAFDLESGNKTVATKLFQYLSYKDMLFNLTYSPFEIIGNGFRNQYIANIKADLKKLESELFGYFGKGAPLDIKWSDVNMCLWNANGEIPKYKKSKYMSRYEIHILNYLPMPIFLPTGGLPFNGVFPRQLTNLVPMWMDRFLNPELVILKFAFIFIISAVLLYMNLT